MELAAARRVVMMDLGKQKWTTTTRMTHFRKATHVSRTVYASEWMLSINRLP